MFRIEFSSQSYNFLRKSETQLAFRIKSKIKLLAKNPFPNDVKSIISTDEKSFRVRVGEYRVQYQVYFESNTILISKIGKRDKFYMD